MKLDMFRDLDFQDQLLELNKMKEPTTIHLAKETTDLSGVRMERYKLRAHRKNRNTII